MHKGAEGWNECTDREALGRRQWKEEERHTEGLYLELHLKGHASRQGKEARCC